MLGIVQGLTEFLPISSSGHLVLFQNLFHLKDVSGVLAFDVALHFGTLLAVTFIFRRDLRDMTADTLSVLQPSRRKEGHAAARLALLVVVATLPAVVVGLGFKHQIEKIFVSSPLETGIEFIITGVVLWLTRKITVHSKGEKDATLRFALLVGIAQAIAILPAISRSGMTMAMALFLGFDQIFAARFSFLMSIPAILGSVVLEGKDIGHILPGHQVPILLGTLVSAITGFLAIKWLLRIISRGRLYLFSYYCWAIGILTLIIAHG